MATPGIALRSESRFGFKTAAMAPSAADHAHATSCPGCHVVGHTLC
jgi:hypothetical protein